MTNYKNLFHGYYDNSPFNPMNSDLVALNGNNRNSFFVPKKKSDIILYSISANSIVKKIDSTLAWNWQQGARIIWLDRDHIIFNKYSIEKNDYYARKVNINTMEFIDYKKPIQELSGEFFLSINYKSLDFNRPDYAYFAHNKSHSESKLVWVDKTNLITGDHEVLISNTDIDKLFFDHGIHLDQSYSYWVNHIMSSPNNKQFIFVLRYSNDGKRKHILCSYRYSDGLINIILKNQTISHFNWINDDEIVVFIVDGSFSGYVIFNINNNSIVNSMEFCDGHPSKFKDSNILTDTYPNKLNVQELLVIDLENGEFETIKQYSSPTFFVGKSRCDLHPSLNKEMTNAIVDVVFKGRRLIDIVSL